MDLNTGTLNLDAYRLLFEANPHPIFLFETDGWRILAANAAAERLYGWTRDELTRMTLVDIRPPAERERFLSSAPTVPEGINRLGHVVHQARDGRLIHVDVTTASITLENGRQARLSVITDITEVQQLHATR